MKNSIDKLDVDLCLLVDNQVQRDNCLRQIAVGLSDLQICNMTNNELEDERNSFVALCIMDIVKKTSNNSLCESISEYNVNSEKRNLTQECILSVAVDSGDVFFCDKFEKDLKKNCILQVVIGSGNYTGCEQFEGISSKEFCYSEVALKSDSPLVCEQIASLKMKDNCYNGVAVLRKDMGLCGKISSLAIKNECERLVTG